MDLIGITALSGFADALVLFVVGIVCLWFGILYALERERNKYKGRR